MVKYMKLNVKRLVIAIIAVIIVFIGLFFILKKVFKTVENIQKEDMFISSINYNVPLYDLEYNEKDVIIRGTKVSVLKDKIINNDLEYNKITYNKNDYYILSENLVKDEKEILKEKEMYVRTPVTIYKDATNPDILSFAKKATKLEILGYDYLNEDGSVNMYEIKIDGIKGYVYSKYLVNTYEEAIKNYDEEVTYQYHKNRTFSYELYGGKASNLDYYPYEKANFENNVMPDKVRAIYLNAGSDTLGSIDSYINLAKNNNVNTFVIDLKDGYLAYQSEVAKEYTISSYKTANFTKEKFETIINKVKDAGFYVVGRIVVFNDSHFAKDNQTESIVSNAGTKTNWTSAYSRKAWEYNVKLSIEAIKWFGFNEIQFDYVRFPESSYTWSKKNYDFKNNYNEEKAQAIQNFLFYATDQIHKYNAYLSADVFGESSYTYVSAYGQYWPAISNIVDAISAMPYTDHFDRKNPNTWRNPYNTVYTWAMTASARQKEIPTPAKARTWLTAYDTPNWNVEIIYGANEFGLQIKALEDAGLMDGYIPWNAWSSYSKYSEITKVYKDY